MDKATLVRFLMMPTHEISMLSYYLGQGQTDKSQFQFYITAYSDTIRNVFSRVSTAIESRLWLCFGQKIYLSSSTPSSVAVDAVRSKVVALLLLVFL